MIEVLIKSILLIKHGGVRFLANQWLEALRFWWCRLQYGNPGWIGTSAARTAERWLRNGRYWLKRDQSNEWREDTPEVILGSICKWKCTNRCDEWVCEIDTQRLPRKADNQPWTWRSMSLRRSRCFTPVLHLWLESWSTWLAYQFRPFIW